ncbi:hypothetical protein AAFF_G00332170 [Aldrovandia affinis]|uniref:ALMS motif domain-containing protein n=1 Tax=Aldrovandia affinis TaxID=143900 RepID=A0AAD7SLV8_9TELE|nr:hypothetical protein AAFF_G00332170 [Aldrovandia affinis]
MEMKQERWGQLPELHRKAGGESDRPPSRGPSWRRSVDESYWESLMSELEVVPRAPRPQSCIGGVGVEGWLQQLERAQGGPPGTHARAKMPPLSDRTASMPALNAGATGTPSYRRNLGHASPYGRSCAPHRPSSWYRTPLGSEEDFFGQPGQWETARLLRAPRAEPVRISMLPSVRNGWLPIQRKAVVCDIPCHVPSLEDSTCRDQFSPSSTTVIPRHYLKKNGLEHTEGKEIDKSPTQANRMDPSTRRLPGQTSPSIMQASDKGGQALPEGESPLGWEWRRKGREERRSAFFSEGIRSGDYNGAECSAPRRYSPLQRRISAPVPSCTTAPPADAETPPKKRAGFSSITISAQRVPQSQTAPSNPGTAAQSGEERSPPVNHACTPGVRMRRASVIKVTEMGRRSSCAGETGPGVRPPQFRHSYTEGEDKENALSRLFLQGRRETGFSLLQSPAQPCAHTDMPVQPGKSRSVSLAEPAGGGDKIYRSTLSLTLGSPSSGERAAGNAGRPRRPLSFAGVFQHADPGLRGLPDPAVRRPSHGSLEKANIGRGSDAACNSNTRPFSAHLLGTPTSLPNTESSRQDVGNKGGPGLHLDHSKSQHSAIVKAQERGALKTDEAVLALNAASIIANIKLQMRLNKMASLISAHESKEPQDPGPAVAVKDSGSHEGGPPDGGVVRRAQGNAGRKARPRPILGGSIWPEPLSDQREDNVAPLTLRESLELLRPDFIRRSQQRVKEVEQRAQKRRAQQRSTPEPESTQGTGSRHRTKPNPLSDNRCKVGERASMGREMAHRSKRNYSNLPGIKKRREEEKKKVMTQTNRLRADVFKKKLLDQVLQRNTD